MNKARASAKPLLDWREWPKFVESEAIASIEEARLANSSCKDLLPDRLVDYMKAEFEAGGRKGFEIASRVFSVRDAVARL